MHFGYHKDDITELRVFSSNGFDAFHMIPPNMKVGYLV
jgi:hypothetical protein